MAKKKQKHNKNSKKKKKRNKSSQKHKKLSKVKTKELIPINSKLDESKELESYNKASNENLSDLEEAVIFFKLQLRKATQGDMNAQYNVANMYRDGKIVRQDLRNALNFYIEAANQGHADAHFEIGLMFIQGQGVDKPLPDEGIKRIMQASSLGSREAKKLLRETVDQGQEQLGMMQFAMMQHQNMMQPNIEDIFSVHTPEVPLDDMTPEQLKALTPAERKKYGLDLFMQGLKSQYLKEEDEFQQQLREQRPLYDGVGDSSEDIENTDDEVESKLRIEQKNNVSSKVFNKAKTDKINLKKTNDNLSKELKVESEFYDSNIASLVNITPKKKLTCYVQMLVKEDKLQHAKRIASCSDNVIDRAAKFTMAFNLHCKNNKGSKTYEWLTKDIDDFDEQMELCNIVLQMIKNDNAKSLKFMLPALKKYPLAIKQILSTIKDIDTSAKGKFIAIMQSNKFIS